MKHYVLDTNVLLDNPDTINSFPDSVVVLPMQVIEELDRFKSDEEHSWKARQIIRLLDTLRTKGSLDEGVELGNGSVLKIFVGRGRNPGLNMSSPDNRILSVAYTLHDKGDDTVFVSGDANVRVKAAALGLEVMDRPPSDCQESRESTCSDLDKVCSQDWKPPTILEEWKEIGKFLVIIIFIIVGPFFFVSKETIVFFLFIFAIYGLAIAGLNINDQNQKIAENNHKTSKSKILPRVGFEEEIFDNTVSDNITDTVSDNITDNVSDNKFDDGFGNDINPATGLPMVGGTGGVDTEGNAYGFSRYGIDN